MARRLEGKKFFHRFHNGVDAIITEDVLRNCEKVSQTISAISEEIPRRTKESVSAESIAVGLSHIQQTPIFTFASISRAATQPWFTGNRDLFEALSEWIEAEGEDFQVTGFYVPFSNASELGDQGVIKMRNELKYVTTESQFHDTFGASQREVEEWYSQKH